jgi:hypothetical protein
MSQPSYRALQVALRIFSVLLAIGTLLMIFSSREFVVLLFLLSSTLLGSLKIVMPSPRYNGFDKHARYLHSGPTANWAFFQWCSQWKESKESKSFTENSMKFTRK